MKLDPIDQANLVAGHAVAAATAFLGGRHDATRLGDNADRLFLDMLVVENAETSGFLIPVQLLAIVMMRTARYAIDIDASEERVKRWEQVMGSLVDLVCDYSRQIKKD